MAFQIQQDLFIFTLSQRFESLLRVALIGADGDRHYAVPSAGALYPYVFDLTFDIPNGALQYRDVRLADLNALLQSTPLRDVTQVQISVAFQPEHARAKYGNRGLTYGMQDCGHVLANLTMAAKSLGLASDLTMHPTSWAIGHNLPKTIPVFDIRFYAADAVLGDLPASANMPDFLSAMMRRRSASAFDMVPCALETVTKVLARSQQIAGHAPAQVQTFGYHLAMRDTNNTWTVRADDRLDGLGVGPNRDVVLNPKTLFCNQEFTTDAAALVFLSAPKTEPEAILDQSIQAGHAGQCFYLAAEMHDIGACCVGGFDYDTAGQILDLPSNHYAAYAMLIGHRAPALPKVDRGRKPTHREAIVEFPAARSHTIKSSSILETSS